MPNDFSTPVAVQIPSDARANGFYAVTQLADAYAISLPADVVANPEQLARYVFENQPAWVDTLMGLRDTLVAGFGIKTAKQLAALSANTSDNSEKRVAIFKIYESNAQEVFLGENDSHLDFRISVQLRPATVASTPQLIVSTVVHCHNLLGRSYITLIAPFHRQVVQAGLRRAAKLGWPRVADAKML